MKFYIIIQKNSESLIQRFKIQQFFGGSHHYQLRNYLHINRSNKVFFGIWRHISHPVNTRNNLFSLQKPCAPILSLNGQRCLHRTVPRTGQFLLFSNAGRHLGKKSECRVFCLRWWAVKDRYSMFTSSHNKFIQLLFICFFNINIITKFQQKRSSGLKIMILRKY